MPKINQNIKLSEEELDLLGKNKNYDYEISLIGRKLTDTELKDKKNLNLDDYGRNLFSGLDKNFN